ncbi:hypothetical protein [Sporichthya sp.]|uniref:hypothetical protein n=1 Tax=Sporichthya sp. TaxID=65475 RepID=UPI0017E23E5C|nr:hypothetical protein [Sporichthya sp.]MBA3745751.1 hypothetical protein [Sporichthya sp.]
MNAQRGLRLPRRGRVFVAGVALLALAGCNGGVAGLNAQATALLHERVAAVRAAADTEDRDAAIAAVDAFKAEIQRLVEAGDLTDSQAASLLAHADAIAADVLSEVLLPTPTPEPTATPEPTPTPVSTPSPEQVQVLQQETAERLTEMLRERLTEYVKQQMEEREAEERAAEQAAQAQEKAERKKAREAKRDRNHGGHDEN